MDYYYHWLKGSVGNTIQIPAVHSGVVYESVDSQVKQPLPQNTPGIPADRKGWWTQFLRSLVHSDRPNRTLLPLLKYLNLTVSASRRICRGIGKKGYMFSSRHTFGLIRLLCSLREWQELWTVSVWCQHRLCSQDGHAGDEWERVRESRGQRERRKRFRPNTYRLI